MLIRQAWMRRPLLVLNAALILLILAGCGGGPSAPGGQPTVYPAPQGEPTAYPAPLGEPTAYPAPQGEPTAYPAPLGEGAATEPPSTSVPAPTRPPMEATLPPQPVATEPQPGQGGVSGEVPEEKIAAAVADLAQRIGVDPAAVTIVSAEAVDWPDGSLGCPQPGVAYLQVITPGYRLVLAANGQEYNYHAARDGEFFLCENLPPASR